MMLLMRPRSTTIVTSRCGAAPVPSISVAWSNTVTCACALTIGSSIAVRIAKMFVRIASKLRWRARSNYQFWQRRPTGQARERSQSGRSAALGPLQFPRRQTAVGRARGEMRARQRHVARQAHQRERADGEPGHVEFPPLVAMPRRTRRSMVIVVPALAVADDA